MRSLRVLAQRLEVPVAALLAPGEGEAPLDETSLAELDRLCRRHEYEKVVVRAQEILEYSRAPELVAGAQYYLGQAMCYLERPEAALDHLAQARELFESFDDDQGRVAETMELEAQALHIAEDPRALAVAQEALHRYRTLDGRRPEVESRLLQRVATIVAGMREFGQARAYYEEALEVAGGVRDLARLARIYHGIGFCHMHVGDARAAEELLVKAHTLYEAEKRLAGAGHRTDLARVENDIGMLLMRQGELARAEDFFASALQRFEAGRHERTCSHVLLSFGELRQNQGRLGDAIEFVRRAIDLAARFNEVRTVATGHQQLGELRAASGERDLALESFGCALDILRQAGLERRYAECLSARDRALGGARATGTGA